MTPLLLVTTAHPSLVSHTLDGDVHPNLGRLIQPRHTSSIETTAAAGIPWAADNDCFQGLDEVAFVRMLDRIAGLEGCLFVTVPDVVGDCAATLAQFDRWIAELERRELPAALVAQDGLELALDAVQWDRIAAVFIGGSTEWKEGDGALAVAREAKRRGKWVHWGRVNTRRRFDLIINGGAFDSFDGSKWARFRKTYLDQGLSWMREVALAGVGAVGAHTTEEASVHETQAIGTTIALVTPPDSLPGMFTATLVERPGPELCCAGCGRMVARAWLVSSPSSPLIRLVACETCADPEPNDHSVNVDRPRPQAAER